jgi:hypothetical protein
VNGVTESLVKSKKYVIPMAILMPHVTGTIALAYLVDGRFKMPKDAPAFDLNEAAVKPEEVVRPLPTPAAVAPGVSTAQSGDSGSDMPHGPAAPGRTSALLR